MSARKEIGKSGYHLFVYNVQNCIFLFFFLVFFAENSRDPIEKRNEYIQKTAGGFVCWPWALKNKMPVHYGCFVRVPDTPPQALYRIT